MFDKWTLINGKEKPIYLKELEKNYRETDTFDYWRLIFLVEHIEPGFIQDSLDSILVNDFTEKLSSHIGMLNQGLNIRNDRPYTEETWLPLFREINDLITKMKKSQFGRSITENNRDDWEFVKRWAEFAKNRHSGMVKQGHWNRRFKNLRNYELFF